MAPSSMNCPLMMRKTTSKYELFLVSISFTSRSNDFGSNAIGETGKLVPLGYEYNSRDNDCYLDVAQLAKLNRELGFL